MNYEYKGKDVQCHILVHKFLERTISSSVKAAEFQHLPNLSISNIPQIGSHFHVLLSYRLGQLCRIKLVTRTGDKFYVFGQRKIDDGTKLLFCYQQNKCGDKRSFELHELEVYDCVILDIRNTHQKKSKLEGSGTTCLIV